MAPSPGAELALLLLAGFQAMVDDVTAELTLRGHEGVRPVHEFAMRAIDAGASTAADLGRQLGVSRQAAAKTIAALEELGYVNREPDPVDGRRLTLRVTRRGHDMMTTGSALFDEVRERWATQIGRQELEALETHLGDLVTPSAFRPDGVTEPGRPPASPLD